MIKTQKRKLNPSKKVMEEGMGNVNTAVLVNDNLFIACFIAHLLKALTVNVQ